MSEERLLRCQPTLRKGETNPCYGCHGESEGTCVWDRTSCLLPCQALCDACVFSDHLVVGKCHQEVIAEVEKEVAKKLMKKVRERLAKGL